MLAIVPVKVDPSAAVHPLVVEGFVDETLAWLARVGSLTVLSPSAVVEWADAPHLLRAARSIAGVTVVLSGALRRSATSCSCTSDWTTRPRAPCCGPTG